MTITLRPTKKTDIPFVIELEHGPENSPYLLPWQPERHLEALSSPDIRHLIAEQSEIGQPVGYVILSGLAQPHDSIELMRITLDVKGKGYGRTVLRQVKQWAFIEQKVNRLWLDVKETNERALQLYLSEGFRVEGTLRECLKTGDVYESLIVLSMLSREYASS